MLRHSLALVGLALAGITAASAASPPTILSLSDSAAAINSDEIAELNAMEGLTWEAGENEFLADKTISDVKTMLGAILLDESTDPTPVLSHETGLLRGISIPTEFDARTKWPKNIHPIRNQKKCGSCWAFSASEVLSDRFSIATNGSDDTVLSPEDLVSCDKTNMGCSGGQLPAAWKYLENTGIVSDKCFPYGAGNGDAPSCEVSCQDGETFATSKHKAKNYYKLKTVEDIQKDIMTNGPVQAAFRVYKSFMSYKSGVYQRDWWKIWDMIMGGHAIKIVGWGTMDGADGKPVDYWTVANSWDTTWGEDGYFKIKRGVNECGIEGNVYAGLPAV